MFRERPGYAEGGEIRRYESREYNPVTGNFERVIREGSNYLGYGQSDPIVSIFDKEKGFVDINVPTIDPFSGQSVSAQDQEAIENINKRLDYLKSLDPNYLVPGSAGGMVLEDAIAIQQETLNDILNKYTNQSNIPTIDPFSGQPVSAQDQAAFTQPQTDIFSTGVSTPTTTEVPTIDPFSGQQVSMQDQMAFVQPQADIFPQQNIFQPPSPVDQFIGERRFQSEADAAARSGIPFTKTIQDYLPNIGFNVPGHMDYFNQIREAGLPTSEYHRLGTADLVQRNIDQLPSILKPIAGAIAPVTALTMSIPYELTQASQRMEPGSGIGGFYNAYMNESPFSAASNRFIGAAQPLANQIQNLLSPVASSAQRSQQEAAARVTPRMTMMYGGLTNTIPPAKGPDSQGVESLFRRRYN